VQRALRTAWQAFWSFDAVLFVLAYKVLLLILPMPRTKAPVAGR